MVQSKITYSLVSASVLLIAAISIAPSASAHVCAQVAPCGPCDDHSILDVHVTASPILGSCVTVCGDLCNLAKGVVDAALLPAVPVTALLAV